jgi:integrase/recombinase XerD
LGLSNPTLPCGVPPGSLSATQNISCEALQASSPIKSRRISAQRQPSIGPAKRNRLRNGTRVTRPSAALLSTFRGEDSRHELPPPNHFGYRKSRRVPHIYSRAEIDGLVRAATRLPSSDSLLPKTYAALISLLAATGLRISEALHLLVSDITPNGLLIRRTKFQKTRLVPLHDTAVAGLAHYLMHRQETQRGGDHVFVSDEGQPLVYWKVHSVFRTLLKSAGIQPSGGRWPRIHELRHTLAVRALESSPTGRQRIGQHMLALATYLGHVNINATYWYLETTPELLRDIAVVAENFVQGGQL